ncbi:UNVERIFIED_ORG: hypothetical protein GGI57_003659 [Rhizobium aethiopicum]
MFEQWQSAVSPGLMPWILSGDAYLRELPGELESEWEAYG